MVAKLIPAFPYHLKRVNYSTNYPKSYESWEETFDELMKSELEVNCGFDMDVFIYYRQIEGDDQGKDKIYSYNNEDIDESKIKRVKL